MKPLTANLKLLYQCRLFSILYAGVVVCSLLPFWLIPHGKGSGTGVYALSATLFVFFIGLIIAVIHSAAASKPFSFLLPDHRKTQQQLFFVIGGVSGLVSSLLYLAHANLKLEPASLGIIAAAAASALAFYLLIAGLALKIMPKLQPTDFPFFLFLFLLISAVIGGGFFIAINSFIFSHPLPILLVSALLAALAWQLIASRELARGLLLNSSRSRHRAMSSGTTAGTFESIFLSLMTGRRSTGLARSIWGSAYVRLRSYSLFYWFLSSIILLWSVPGGYITVNFAIFAGIIGLIPLIAGPINSPLILAMGRLERFAAGISVALVELIIAISITMIAFGISSLLSHFMPPPYRNLDMRLLYLPLILMPIDQAFHLATARNRLVLCGLLFCVFLPLFFYFVFKSPMLSHSIGLPLVLLANAGLWGLMAHECFCRDLAVSNR
jgi:hypothetical protein